MISHFTNQSQTCQLLEILKIIFFIEKKSWKMVQSQIELIRINFMIEALILQVQIITYIIY